MALIFVLVQTTQKVDILIQIIMAKFDILKQFIMAKLR